MLALGTSRVGLASWDVILDLLWFSVASTFPLGYPCPHCHPLSPHFEGGCCQPLATFSLLTVIPGILQDAATLPPGLGPWRQCPAYPLCHPLGTGTFSGYPQPVRAPFWGWALFHPHPPLSLTVRPQVRCLTQLESPGGPCAAPGSIPELERAPGYPNSSSRAGGAVPERCPTSALNAP